MKAFRIFSAADFRFKASSRLDSPATIAVESKRRIEIKQPDEDKYDDKRARFPHDLIKDRPAIARTSERELSIKHNKNAINAKTAVAISS